MRSFALLGLAGVLIACANPAENKPKAEVQEPAPKTDAPAMAATYAITPENSKINWVGSKVTGSHDGGFHQFTGTIEVPGSNISGGRVSLDIDMHSVWADNERLTGHLKTADFFEVDSFPKSTFVSTALVPSGDTAWMVTGNLTMHGIEKSVSFPAKIAVSAAGVTVNSEFVINRRDWNIRWDGQPDNLVRDEVVMKLAINATPAGGAQPM